jgi:hypothetical protein
MCSISTNPTANDQLEKLERSNDKNMIERRLSKFAEDSDINKSDILDEPKNHMKRMPLELKDVKKIQIGRHRVYYTGHHTKCSYLVFYIKQFKKSDKNKEDDKKFQNKLIRFLDE